MRLHSFGVRAIFDGFATNNFSGNDCSEAGTTDKARDFYGLVISFAAGTGTGLGRCRRGSTFRAAAGKDPDRNV